ncbi:MAG: threonine/serine exporter family protein [Termitinemataceae bacterium]
MGILWAFFASGSFGIIFNVRGKDIPLAASGGGLGWFVYSLVSNFGPNEGVSYFLSAIAIALFAEIVAAFSRRPATTYLVCALIPLVPGGGMYYTLAESLKGDLQGTLLIGFNTLTIAGALAAGVAIGSAIARLAKRL